MSSEPSEYACNYDSMKHLVKAEYPNATEELFYDKAGNRTKRLYNGAEELYQYDKRNRLTAHTKGGVTTQYEYDNAGNLLKDGRARYEYDAFNRNAKAETFDGNIQINRYDAEGLRHEMEENGKLVTFIFRGNEAVTEETDSNIIRHIRGYDLIASDAENARTYYHYASDEMSSITHVVEGTQVLNHYEYDAWGNLTACEEKVQNRFRFNGQQYDSVTQQYYLRARYYNPVIGRFTQEDTYNADGLNLYAYCRNNPVYYVDPSGNICEKRANTLMDNVLDGGQLTRKKRRQLKAKLRDEARNGTISDKGRDVARQMGIDIDSVKVKISSQIPSRQSATRDDGSKPVATPNHGQGFSSKGYNPKPGERTFEGYVNNNVPRDVETKLFTNSNDFNTNPKNDGHFKRFGTEPNQHGITGPHVHQPTRNVNPNNGIITGKPGSKTKSGGVTISRAKDIKQLYEYLNNSKYH